jgi:hypothetical protein
MSLDQPQHAFFYAMPRPRRLCVAASDSIQEEFMTQVRFVKWVFLAVSIALFALPASAQLQTFTVGMRLRSR